MEHTVKVEPYRKVVVAPKTKISNFIRAEFLLFHNRLDGCISVAV